MRYPPYDKQAVLNDIAEQKLSPMEISEKYGITVGNVYTIKASARRHGILNSRGLKTIDMRLADEARVLDIGLRERIKDMREMDLTSTEITDLLRKEGLQIDKEDVVKVMARGAAQYALNRPNRGKVSG